MKNELCIIGLIGVLGFLGVFTDNPGYYGFFSFFSFFVFAKVLPDEMLKRNINRAAKNAFFSSVIFFPIVAIWGAVTSFSVENGLVFGFAINFALQSIIFGISLARYEAKGDV